MTIQKIKGRVTGVYGITYKDKIYIGSSIHIRNRWNQHMSDMKQGVHSCQALQRIFDAYNKDCLGKGEAPSFECFDFFVIKTLDQEFATYHYNRFVELLGTKRKASDMFCNLILFKIEQVYMNMNPKQRLNSLPAAGSNKGKKPKKATRKKIGDAQLGRKRSPETRKKQSEARMGTTMKLESRQKLSKSKMGVPRSPEATKKIAAKLSKPYSFYHEDLGVIEGFGIKPLVREMKAKGIKASSSGLRAVLDGTAAKNHGFYRDEQSYLDELAKKSKQSSQETGVYYHINTKRWVARNFKKPNPYIGSFKTEQEAIDAVRKSKNEDPQSA